MLLIINPNSSQEMTKNLQLNFAADSSQFVVWSPTTGPNSINNEEDGIASTVACLETLPSLDDFEGVLIACFSEHPLVEELKSITTIPVIGILEASISYCLLSLRLEEKFGIVSTGSIWKELLGEAVSNLLGGDSKRYSGTETTGLNAVELHESNPEIVKLKMKEATKRLLRDRDVCIIVLGCAGMSGMEAVVREAIVEMRLARRIQIVDGVRVGSKLLDSLVALQ